MVSVGAHAWQGGGHDPNPGWGETVHGLRGGETIVLPAGMPHAVRAQERFKMLLTVVFTKA